MVEGSKIIAYGVKFLNPQDTVIQDTLRIVGLREPVVENPDILLNHLSQPDSCRRNPKRVRPNSEDSYAQQTRLPLVYRCLSSQKRISILWLRYTYPAR